MDSQTAAEQTVLAERQDGVLVLTLNRPDRLNAWTNELEARYFELLDEAEADPEVGAIVVTGAGRGFCAGADMELLSDAAEGSHAHAEHTRPRTYPLRIRKPLIAAINGAAAGLGLIEALYCDLRFCSREAKLTTSFARRGLIAEHGIAWLLPRLVGPSAALDLLMSGRVVLGDEARQLGLVDRVGEREAVLEDAVAYARDLAANCSPTSMATMKAQVWRDLERGFDEGEAEADRLMMESFTRADVQEGVDSYLEKRRPSFPPLAPVG